MKVFIVPPIFGCDSMYRDRGWDVVSNINEADLVQFTGGADIHPSLYKHDVHPSTYFSLSRDKYEVAAFHYCKDNKIPMAGICRGAQLFTAMTGGWLWQDVDGHQGYHDVIDTVTGEVFNCNSIHHQMMFPPKTAKILAIAKESSRKERCAQGRIIIRRKEMDDDPEVVFFPTVRALGFQGHPEMAGGKLRDIYFKYIEDNLQIGM